MKQSAQSLHTPLRLAYIKWFPPLDAQRPKHGTCKGTGTPGTPGFHLPWSFWAKPGVHALATAATAIERQKALILCSANQCSYWIMAENSCGACKAIHLRGGMWANGFPTAVRLLLLQDFQTISQRPSWHIAGTWQRKWRIWLHHRKIWTRGLHLI